MSDLTKAVLKVAKSNPEFGRALVAEVRKTARVRTGLVNTEVREVLKRDFGLFLVFFSRFSGIDSDLDPTHNPDWVARRKKEEMARLKETQKEFSALKAAHVKMKTV
jgi:hypothetical protein